MDIKKVEVKTKVNKKLKLKICQHCFGTGQKMDIIGLMSENNSSMSQELSNKCDFCLGVGFVDD